MFLIEKFKYDWETYRTKIQWRNSNTDDAGRFSFEIIAELPNEIKEILLQLREYVKEVCELDVPLHQITIIGVSYSWTKEIMGVTVTALRELLNSNSPLVINTPHKIEQFYAETGSEKH